MTENQINWLRLQVGSGVDYREAVARMSLLDDGEIRERIIQAFKPKAWTAEVDGED